MRLALSQGTAEGKPLQILTARWKIFEEIGIPEQGVRARLNDENTQTYSLYTQWGNFDSQTSEAAVELNIPDYFQSGIYSLNHILMYDIARNARGVYFTHPGHGLREEDEVLDEAPATIEIHTTNPDDVPPVLDLNRINVQAEPTNSESPNGETQVDISFRIKDDISGYRATDIYLRDPQGVDHRFRHHDPDFYKVYFSRDPTVYQTYRQTIILPVGSIPGTWGLAEMTVFDKAQNKLQADFTEILHFEVLDPDSTVVIYEPVQAIPQTVAAVSGDDQQGLVGATLVEPFVVLVLDQNGVAYAGATVTFAITAGDGTLSVETATTDTSGLAASILTLGSWPGPNIVEVTVEGLEPVTFSIAAQATPDFNGDGVTDFFDFFLFADAFGSFDARFDLDGSGTVDFGDFFMFADAFGQPSRAKLVALARKRIGLPDDPQLQQNTPNPFNSQTVIPYLLLKPGPTRVEVFALTGQRVAVLDQGQKQAGRHRLLWDGRDREGRPMASGIYLYRLVTPEDVLSRKLTLLR